MLSVLNCFLLVHVILAIFVPYFYPRENLGADFRGLDRRLWCKRVRGRVKIGMSYPYFIPLLNRDCSLILLV